MQASEAKDFLVQQVKEQANLEGERLSNLEVRLLYFNQQSALTEETRQVKELLDASNSSKEYEKKVSQLLENAYKRICQQSPVSKKTWADAIRCLRYDGHYLSVMWDIRPGNKIPKVLVAGFVLLVTTALIVGWLLLRIFGPPKPHVLLAILLTIVFVKLVFKNPGTRIIVWVVRAIFWYISKIEGGNENVSQSD